MRRCAAGYRPCAAKLHHRQPGERQFTQGSALFLEQQRRARAELPGMGVVTQVSQLPEDVTEAQAQGVPLHGE